MSNPIKPKPAGILAWLNLALTGHRASIAKAITAVEEGHAHGMQVLEKIYPLVGQALVVGFTGAPGCGKSTLVSAFIQEVLQRGLQVGVVAIDPTSPLTGGAVLGDRIRMLGVASDPRVYMRSLAARGHLGGLSAATSRIIDVLDAVGKNIIVVETVGVGQSETEISQLAHVNIVVCSPGMGDDVQMIKAGVLETADIFVVNKSDLPDSKLVLQQLRAAAHMGKNPNIQVLQTVATTGAGVSELVQACLEIKHQKMASADEERAIRVQRTLQSICMQSFCEKLKAIDPTQSQQVSNDFLKGKINLNQAVDLIFSKAIALKNNA